MRQGFLAFLLCAAVFPGAVSAGDLSAPPMRIISLSPSTTEILFAMGLGDRIVGVTNYCDYPEEAKKRPKVGGMSNPSLEAVVSLRPDVVVMTTDGNPKEFEDLLRSLHIRTVVFTARRIVELPQGIRDLGASLGVRPAAEKLAGRIEQAVSGLRSGEAPGAASPRKVLYIVWPEPLLVAGPGTAIDDAITLLGHRNIASSALSAYPKYSLEDVLRQAPDVIVVGKGSGMDMVEVSRSLISHLKSVPAVRNNDICYLGDGLYRLGPRVIQGIEELAQCLDRKSQR